MSWFLIKLLDSDADKVTDIMEEITEQNDIQDQISEAISRPGLEMYDDVSRTISLLYDVLYVIPVHTYYMLVTGRFAQGVE